MREALAVALSLVALLGAVAVAVPATVAAPASTATPGASGSAVSPGGGQGVIVVEASSANNSSMGAQVASFMQATTGETGEEVEAGMWNAAYENASNRTAVVHRRANNIESRLAELAAEKRQLVDARENGTISQAEYTARMSNIVGRMAALNRSIADTEAQARASGADMSVVARLRGQARNLSGPEVAEVARSIAGGPPSDVGPPQGAGPPPGAGPPNGSAGPPNGTAGPPNGSAGPPNGSAGPPNGSAGPPNGSAGPPNGSGGPPNGSGNGGDGGPPDDGDGGDGGPPDDGGKGNGNGNSGNGNSGNGNSGNGNSGNGNSGNGNSGGSESSNEVL